MGNSSSKAVVEIEVISQLGKPGGFGVVYHVHINGNVCLSVYVFFSFFVLISS